jgi:Transposase and inactivated derivatives
MDRYSNERKAALLKKLLPPINLSVAELARQENISEVTLYNWRKQAKAGGSPVPGDNKLTDEGTCTGQHGTPTSNVCTHKTSKASVLSGSR